LTFTVTDWPGFSVSGNEAPDTAKAEPLMVAELMVTGAVPEDVSVSGRVVAELIVTSPKLRLAALSVNCGLVAALPVPVRLTTAGLLLDELLSTVNRPDTGPVVVGSNCRSNVTD